ncbi:hypothetical protein VTN77DRAFT_5318 [Rasamsonia byssochlamydoides]|uniref:uncharacterized protein n=1 Tax=Rasamsonia byssochlamydoides TaxID=89139 RepID=UPI003742A324
MGAAPVVAKTETKERQIRTPVKRRDAQELSQVGACCSTEQAGKIQASLQADWLNRWQGDDQLRESAEAKRPVSGRNGNGRGDRRSGSRLLGANNSRTTARINAPTAVVSVDRSIVHQSIHSFIIPMTRILEGVDCWLMTGNESMPGRLWRWAPRIPIAIAVCIDHVIGQGL